MKTTETVNHVAAPAADRASLPASPHIKPFIALALAVILPSLGRNPRSGRRPKAQAAQRPGRGRALRRHALPETRKGLPPMRGLRVPGLSILHLENGGLRHG